MVVCVRSNAFALCAVVALLFACAQSTEETAPDPKVTDAEADVAKDTAVPPEDLAVFDAPAEVAITDLGDRDRPVDASVMDVRSDLDATTDVRGDLDAATDVLAPIDVVTADLATRDIVDAAPVDVVMIRDATADAPDLATDVLRRCTADRDCTGDARGPACELLSGRCVACVSDAQCPLGRVCSASACVAGCSSVSLCPAGQSCCAGMCLDTRSDVSMCGGCGVVCSLAHATPRCVSGACGVRECAAGFGDCDGRADDGCEADLSTDPANCGGCGVRPPERCNLADDDCDGMCDESAGCRRSVSRSVSRSTGEHFYTTDVAEAGCCGFTLEHSAYYWLYADSQPTTVPFYRCALTRFHLYTTDPGCEGAGTMEGIMGYIATGPTCGAVPLYRLAHRSNGDHFYTTSESERDSAIGSGYILESTIGYVWTAGG